MKIAAITETKSENAIKKARESGAIAARIEVGEWIEANMLNSPYNSVYTSIFLSIIKRLKEGKRL
jgi:hypothetical protein